MYCDNAGFLTDTNKIICVFLFFFSFFIMFTGTPLAKNTTLPVAEVNNNLTWRVKSMQCISSLAGGLHLTATKL